MSGTEWHLTPFCLKGPNEIPCSWNIIDIIVVRFGAMVRKVAITQTQVRGTQLDSNTLALADDAMTFLLTMTER